MKTEYLHIRINPNLKEELAKVSEEEGKSISEWVTDLIKIELAKKKEV